MRSLAARSSCRCYGYDLAQPLTFQASSGDPTAISYGESGTYELASGDGSDPDGDLARPFAFSGTGGDEVVITMRSEAFDTNLILTGPGGSVVASNDDIDLGSNTNSRIRTTLSSTGEHTIWCGSWIGTETGAFELSLTRQ